MKIINSKRSGEKRSHKSSDKSGSDSRLHEESSIEELKPNDSLDAGSRNEHESTKEHTRLTNKAVRLLSVREHSVKELREKLLSRTTMPELVSRVIERVIEYGYLSDERYAEVYVRSRKGRGFGPVRVGVELKNKGVDSHLIEEYVDKDSRCWFESARVQYQKKYGDSPVVDYAMWTKRARFMQSRGFNMEHINATIPVAESH